MKQKIYIPQPIAAAGEDYLIEKGYEIVRGSGKTDKESIKNDIINTISNITLAIFKQTFVKIIDYKSLAL